MEERFGFAEVGGVKIYNTTPYPVKILDESGKVVVEVPEARDPLRLFEDYSYCGSVDGCQIFRKTYITTDLPPEQKNTFYIVQYPVARISYRRDIVPIQHVNTIYIVS